MTCAADAMVPRGIGIGEKRAVSGVRRSAAVFRFSTITRIGANDRAVGSGTMAPNCKQENRYSMNAVHEPSLRAKECRPETGLK